MNLSLFCILEIALMNGIFGKSEMKERKDLFQIVFSRLKVKIPDPFQLLVKNGDLKMEWVFSNRLNRMSFLLESRDCVHAVENVKHIKN